METIRDYLNNMFANLPKTARVTDLKNNILSNMEEKYNELKSMGKSENEAIGIVISEFGNIDELVNELGIKRETREITELVVNSDEVDAYLNIKRKAGIQIGLGVFLCILAPALLILISVPFGKAASETGLSEDTRGILGVIALFILITIAVGIFIYSGMGFERYKYMEKGVHLPGNIEAELKQQYGRYVPVFYLKLIIAVCLMILSPISIFITYLMKSVPDELGPVIVLIIIAAAVFIIISISSIKEGYERLLHIGDYKREPKKEDRVIGAVAAIVWPLAVVIYLISGLVYNNWGINWIVFPVTGILFGMFSAAYNILTGNKTR